MQSIRDKELNKYKEYICEELHKVPKEWYVKYMKHEKHDLTKSKSQKRWSFFITLWRNDRWEGDDELFRKSEEWRMRDKHLFLYQKNLLDQKTANREDLYRKIGANLANKYNVLVIENIDLMNFQKKSEIESDDLDVIAVRRQQRTVAPHEFINILINAFVGRGLIVVKVDPENTTKKCNVCGNIRKLKDPDGIIHTCNVCGTTCDRDDNASRNIYNIYVKREEDENKGKILEILRVKNEKNSKWKKLGRHEKRVDKLIQ